MTTTDAGTTTAQAPTQLPSRTAQVPRSRGALSGVLLIVLGAWGALIPFVGPYFNLSYTPDTAWHWTSARGWLEVLPGAVAFVGGVLSLMSARRGVISIGAWLGVAAGAWFVVGRGLSDWWNIGSPGVPAGTSTAVRAAETLVMFTGLGAVILVTAASAVGRLSVTTVRDARVAQRRAAKVLRRDRRDQDAAYQQGRTDALAEAQATGQNPTGTNPTGTNPTTAYPTGTNPTTAYPTTANPTTANPSPADAVPPSATGRPVGQHEVVNGATAPTATTTGAPAPPPAPEQPVQPR